MRNYTRALAFFLKLVRVLCSCEAPSQPVLCSRKGKLPSLAIKKIDVEWTNSTRGSRQVLEVMVRSSELRGRKNPKGVKDLSSKGRADENPFLIARSPWDFIQIDSRKFSTRVMTSPYCCCWPEGADKVGLTCYSFYWEAHTIDA